MATSKLPASWSNKNKIEWLDRGAYEALSRALNRAVADTGVNFSIWSAGRSKAEQVALFKQNYAPAGRGRKLKSDRSYAGRIWARKPGGVNVASPDLGSNHEDGRAVDIHPAAIQNWFKSNGALYGWSWDEGRRVGENWHFRYVPSLDQMKHEGLLDHAAVQRVVGATVDGKIGTGTISKIKAWQKAHGLTADGKVGAGTKRAMGLAGKGDAAPAPVIPVGPVGGASVPAPAPERKALSAAVDGVFPWADATTQFWDEKYPTQEYTGGKPIGLLHSTETGTWPGYGGGSSAPHLTLRFDPATMTVSARQHYSTTRPSRALVNRAGGVQTNNARVFQIELIGSCDLAFATKHDYPYLPDLLEEAWARDALAGVLAAVSESLDIPLATSVSWASYPGSYGEKAAQRLSGEEWEEYTGWLGHQHAPENDHGDPGDIPIGDVLAAARGGVTAPIQPAPSTPSIGGVLPTGKELLMKLNDLPDFPLLRTPGNLCYYGGDGKQTAVSGKMPNSLVPGEITGTGSKSGAQGLKTWQAQMVKRGYSLTVDGRYGDATENAAKNLQRLAGLAQDGKIGPTTFYAAWLLPVVS